MELIHEKNIGEMCLMHLFEKNRVGYINKWDGGAYEIYYLADGGKVHKLERTRRMKVRLFPEGVPEYLETEAKVLESLVVGEKWDAI